MFSWSSFNESPVTTSVALAFNPKEVVISEALALSASEEVTSVLFAFNPKELVTSKLFALSAKPVVRSVVFAFNARFVIVEKELKSWSPVLEPLKVMIPNLVLMVAVVSSPSFVPVIAASLFFSVDV